MTLYKNKQKKIIFGVVAGLHDALELEKRFKLSLEVTRWSLVGLAVLTRQPLFLLYLLLALILPDKEDLT